MSARIIEPVVIMNADATAALVVAYYERMVNV